jgi:GxxExxY protein
MPLTVASTLPAETEAIMERIIGCAIAVHRELGPGFLERIYVTALCLELQHQGLPYERERSIAVLYRETPIHGQRVDLIVANAVIVEVKAVARMEPVFHARLISYLRTAKLRAGLLMNFNESLLKDGIKRIVL